MNETFKWLRITFTDLEPKTDIFMYRQMSEMLVPQKGSTNRFRISTSKAITDIFIGSDDMLSLKFMKSFFSRLYRLKFDDVNEELIEPEIFSVFRISRRRKSNPVIVPSLLQNLTFVHSVVDVPVIIDSAIYRVGNEKASVAIRIGFIQKEAFLAKIEKSLQPEIRKFSKQSGIHLRKIKNWKQFNILKGIDPRQLINFVRVPLDEDI
jgi:hypothetical protein